MTSTAVVLAGGKGTRLHDAFPGIAKAMVPVAGKPVLEHLVTTYSAQGIGRFIFAVGHLSEQITGHFGDGSAWGVEITYIHEPEPLGTAGALHLMGLTEAFWVFYGDTISDISLNRMHAFHQAMSADATLLVHPNDHPYDSDLVACSLDGKVTAVHGKPHASDLEVRNLVNAALYLMEPSVLSHIPQGIASDFGRDLFPLWASRLSLAAYSSPEYIKDMGKLERHEQVQADIESGLVASRNLALTQRAVFLDRDGVINIDSDLIKHPDEMVLYPDATKSIQALHSAGFVVVVVTNQSVVARGLTDLKGIEAIHARMERLLAEEGAFVDQISFCPHHPDKGYPEEVPAFKIECHCRKPKPGMLLDAASRFNIDCSNSWMVGDSERDILAGQAAGCRTIRVKTGHGLKPSTVVPDAHVAGIWEATTHILAAK